MTQDGPELVLLRRPGSLSFSTHGSVFSFVCSASSSSESLRLTAAAAADDGPRDENCDHKLSPAASVQRHKLSNTRTSV